MLVWFFDLFSSKSSSRYSRINFSYHSFSVSSAGFYTENGEIGIAFSGDIDFNYGQHIVGLSIETGSQAEFFGYNDFYRQASLFYGRDFKLNKRI